MGKNQNMDSEDLAFTINRFDTTQVDKIHLTDKDQLQIFNWLKELALYRKLAGPLKEAGQITVGNSMEFRQAVIEATEYLYTSGHESCVFPESVKIRNKITDKETSVIPVLCYSEL